MDEPLPEGPAVSSGVFANKAYCDLVRLIDSGVCNRRDDQCRMGRRGARIRIVLDELVAPPAGHRAEGMGSLIDFDPWTYGSAKSWLQIPPSFFASGSPVSFGGSSSGISLTEHLRPPFFQASTA